MELDGSALSEGIDMIMNMNMNMNMNINMQARSLQGDLVSPNDSVFFWPASVEDDRLTRARERESQGSSILSVVMMIREYSREGGKVRG